MATGPDTALLKRVAELFDAYETLDAAERAARIARLREDEPEAAAELVRWLAQDEDRDGPLDRLTHRSGASATQDQTDRSGQQIGAYRLLRRVGRGGMGEVYEASRADADFDQKVAVKLLRRGLDSEDIVRRFLRERRILAQLEHPGIARLVDGGMSEDGLPFLVMEFVEGSALIDAVNRRGLDLDARLRLFASICDAVAYAHRRLIVHRDIKPSNVMLTDDGQPKLLDFGIAKLLDEVEDEHLTGTGMRVLTPGYAAPEQILGQPISTATDVYALGIILYELLTGRPPHQRQGKDLERVTHDLDQESVIRPSSVLAKASEPDATANERQRWARRLIGDIDTIVLHALKREPERRYQGAAELADDIRRHLDGHPVRAEADTLNYRLRKFVGRHRGGVTAAALAIFGVLAGLIVALWQADLARTSAARAEAEAARAEREAAGAVESASRTRRVKDFMMETFVAADPLRSPTGAPQTVTEAVDAALKRVDSELADDVKLQIDLLDDFGEIRVGQGRFAEARALFERALALAEKTYGRNHPAVAESLTNLGVVASFEGDVAASVPLLERAIAILEPYAQTEPLALSNAVGNLGAALETQGRREESLALIGRALEVARAHAELGDAQINVALHNYATALLNMDRFAEAEPLIREALALQEKKLGPDSPALDPTLDNLAVVLYRKGDVDAAIAINERRLAMARKHFSGAHPWTASALTDVGEQLVASGKHGEGTAMLREAIAMYTKLGSHRALMPMRYLALALRNEGDLAGALAVFDEGWQYCRDHEVKHIMCALLRGNRAGMMSRMGRAAEALPEAEAAIADFVALGAAGSTEIAQAMESRAHALKALGRRDEAIAAQTEALAIYIKQFGTDHPELERVRKNLKSIRGER